MLFSTISKIKKSAWFYPGFLVLLCILIAILNYTPGTFLTGWDTLHPEFDFPLNFNRLFFGVWRTDQGLGALAAHSHMSDLPRVVLLWLFHFIFPLNSLKYIYLFLCFIVGPLGMYFLIFSVFSLSHYRRLIAFLTALLYIFNLSTVQQFYVPFEMFPTQWAFLPWIMLFSFDYLQHYRPRTLFYFCLATLFATPQAYAAHLWYPFFGLFLAYIFIDSILHRPHFKSSLVLIILTLTINSFWLFPNIYYVLTSSSIPRNARVNRLASQEFLLRNRETGSITDTALIKGFYFNWDIYDFQKSRPVKLMPDWINHLSFNDVELIGYIIFFFCLIGLFYTIIHKDKKLLPFIPFFVIPFVLLANTTFPFNHVFDLLLHISILQEIFRFIFTKVSVVLLFGFCIFFANFLNYFFSHILRRFTQVKIYSIISTITFAIYCYPMFAGALISPKVRVSIPDKYFQLWQYTQKLSDGRFLSLPIHANSGWQYYNWQYQGSGFIWFGLPQSIFDRDSDRWEPNNERAYFDFFYALYANNYENFNTSLQKYQVKYVLWDPSLIATNSKNSNQVTFKYEIEQLISYLKENHQLKEVAKFDDLVLYTTTNNNSLVQLQTSETKSQKIYNFYNDILTATNRIDITKLPINCDNAQCHLKINDKNFEAGYFSLPNVPSDMQTTNATVNISHFYDSLPHFTPYIVAIKSKYFTGIPARFCLWNNYSNMCIFEDELSKANGWDYFLIPSMDEFSGYDFRLNLITYANFLSRTQVDKFLIIPLNNEITNYINNLTPPSPQSTNLASSSIFPNNSLVTTSPNKSNASLLVFNQSYHPGWLAFYFDGFKPVFLPDHTRDNGWANSWQLSSTIHDLNPTIYILFWPQLLEFFGFTLLIGTFVWVIKRK